MDKKKLVLSVLAIPFGVFMIVFGGMDDSPGAQGIGVIAIIIGALIAINARKRN